MFKTTLRNVAAASTVLVCALGGCGAALTPDTAFQDLPDLLLQPADSTTTPEASQADEGDSSAVQGTATSEAGQLLQELEAVLGGHSTGAAGDALNALLTALADVTSSSLSVATSQPATVAHPFRQLRAEIHVLRHTMTPDRAAQLLLSALAASNTMDGSATTGTGSSGFNLEAQVQNLLATLRAMNTQPTTPAGTSTTP